MAYPTIKTEGGVTNAVIAPNLPQHARGTQVIFEHDFFSDAPANTQPTVPSDPANFPSWTIVDPDGLQVGSGVAVAGAQVGRWQFTWNVLDDAVLSTKNGKWSVIWRMLSGARQYDANVLFDVIDLITPDSPEDLHGYGYISRPGKTCRMILKRPRRPAELTVTGYISEIGAQLRPSSDAAFTFTLASGAIKEVEEGSLFAYYVDTPVITDPMNMLIVWDLRETLTSPEESIFQNLYVPHPLFWSMLPDLKGLLDKLMKPQGTVHAYSDVAYYSYFSVGLGMLNTAPPFTTFTWDTFPLQHMTRMFWLEAAALWGLQCQHLLETDLLFSYSGQTVTLDVDRTGALDGVIARMKEDIGGSGPGNWPTMKKALTRATLHPAAFVGVRMLGRRYNQQIVYQVDHSNVGSTGQGGPIDLLSRLGLL